MNDVVGRSLAPIIRTDPDKDGFITDLLQNFPLDNEEAKVHRLRLRHAKTE